MAKKDETNKTETTEETIQIPKSEFEGLKSQLEEMNKFRTETEDYLKGASVVVNTLASDPELTKAFRSRLTGEGGGQQQEQKKTQTVTVPDDGAKTTQYSKDIEEVKSSQREEIIAAFEKDYGISNLPDEDKRESRRKIEGYLNEFGWSISGRSGNQPPLTTLRNQLEKAYVGTHAEKLREEGKLEGFVQARTNSMGAMGSFPSGTLPETQEKDLSPKQKEWAKKLGVDENKAKQTYLDRENEESRLSGAEKKLQEGAE